MACFNRKLLIIMGFGFPGRELEGILKENPYEFITIKIVLYPGLKVNVCVLDRDTMDSLHFCSHACVWWWMKFCIGYMFLSLLV